MDTPSPNDARVQLFVDLKCPMCRREAQMIGRMDKAQVIELIDIAADDFDASAYGKTWETLMAAMHARDRQGQWQVGVEAFRCVYSELGFSKAVAWSRWPILARALNLGYQIFARVRPYLTSASAPEGASCRVPDRVKA